MELPLRSIPSLSPSGDDAANRDFSVASQREGGRGSLSEGAAIVLSLALGSWWATRCRTQPSQGELDKEMAHFRRVLESLPQACWILDQQGRTICANSVGHGLLYGRPGYSGRGSESSWQSPDITDRLSDLTRRALRGEAVKEAFTLPCEDQRRLGLQLLIPTRVDGKVAVLVALFLDTPDPARAKRVGEESDLRFAEHQRPTSWAVIEWELTGLVKEWNPIAESIFGYSELEAIGKSAVSLLRLGDQRVACSNAWRTLRENCAPIRIVLKSRTKSDTEIICEWCSSPLIDAANRVTGVISFAQETTERGQIDARLQQLLQLESMGRLAAGVAHEFNNLLAPMVIEVERIADHAGDPVRVASHVSALRLAIAQAREFTERTQLVAGRSSEGRDWVDLSELVRGAIDRLREKLDRRIQVDLTLDRTLPHLPVSSTAVVQILTNLISNARDAFPVLFDHNASSPWQAEIKVTTSRFRGINPTAPSHGVSRYQVITVRDNGPGLSEAAQAHAFEPFFTTKSPGSGHGLGLALVWRLAQNHEGWATLQSEEGHGCEFRVFLPERPSEHAGLKTSDVAVPASSSCDRRVGLLLVEDNLLVANALAGLLEDRGYRVFPADTGELGWDLLNEQAGLLDLVLCDLNLPGLSGRELLEKIQSSSLPIPVIMMSGYVAQSDTSELNRLGAAALISKPIDPHELLQMVARIALRPT